LNAFPDTAKHFISSTVNLKAEFFSFFSVIREFQKRGHLGAQAKASSWKAVIFALPLSGKEAPPA
jgi:hypothetical protein